MRPIPPPTPARTARNAREGRGLDRFTAAEQLASAACFGGYFLAHTVATRAWDSAWTGQEALALFGPLLAMLVVAMLYEERCPPWPGPRWWVKRRQQGRRRRKGASTAPLRPLSAWARFARWWNAPGRLGLAAAALSGLLVLTSLVHASDDRELINDLRDRGIETSAVIADTDYAARVGRTDTDVRFVVDGVSRDEALPFLNDVATHAPEGTTVTVVYDPDDPSRVLLKEQLDSNRVRSDRIAAWLFAAGVVAGLSWWLIQWPRRRAPQPDV